MSSGLILRPEDFNPGQVKFLQSTEAFSLFCGGFGSGKSFALLMKMLMLKGVNGAIPGLLVAQTFGALYANLVDPLFFLLEQAKVPPILRPKIIGANGPRPFLLWADGAKCHLRSAEIPKGYDGLTVGWLLGDEIRHWSKKAYDIAISRVRMKNVPVLQRAFSSTPAMHWMADEFNAGKDRRQLITAGTIENQANLPDDYVSDLALSYSKRMQRAVLHGIFTILEGAVFEAFDPNPQTSEWLIDYKPTKRELASKRVFLMVDPGFRRSAWMWAVEVEPLMWVVFDEVMQDNKTDIQCVDAVNRKGHPIDEIWVDVASGARQSYGGASTRMAMSRIKTRRPNAMRVLSGANREIAFGVDKVRVLLGGEEGIPIRVKFSKHLVDKERRWGRGIIRDLGSLAYPEKYGAAAMDVPVKDGVTDHSTDAFRYWAVGMWATDPALRRLDPVMRQSTDPGWRAVA